MSYIEAEILTNDMARYTVGLFEKELYKRLEEMASHGEEYQAKIQRLRAERDANKLKPNDWQMQLL